MWLCDSSIGRKVVMSITGLSLILFLTFHASMNVVALISAEGYNMICEFLGANWYAVVATLGLAGLAVLHILYAIWLWVQNRRARGNNRYAVTATPNGFSGSEKIEWLANQNMLVLGIIVVVGMCSHLYNFWYNMMWAELSGNISCVASPGDGYEWIKYTFASCPLVILYTVWFVAIWFHLTHGFWSAMQTLGWSGKTWLCRWKTIGVIYVTIVMAMFLIVAWAFHLCPDCVVQCC